MVIRSVAVQVAQAAKFNPPEKSREECTGAEILAGPAPTAVDYILFGVDQTEAVVQCDAKREGAVESIDAHNRAMDKVVIEVQEDKGWWPW